MTSEPMIAPVFQACFTLWQSDDERLSGNVQTLFRMAPGSLLMTLDDENIALLIEIALTGDDTSLMSKLLNV